ncbi:ATP-binding protein [Methanoregula sp.]|uniref:AAA family ATPase n=1 Tax=Methanoregula sp. TaxID=2052170 RepID=UPI00236B6788|nr:ATP-binding protein [Methanoregula sp.]MDD1685471.1 AAA family ATPase [Methanoregula sp.]
MKVIRLKAKNWRNFQDVDISLQDITFLIGPNASGKSNFIDIFRFLHDIVVIGLQKAITTRGGMSKIRCLSARRYPDIEIEIHLGERYDQSPTWIYSLRIMQEGRRKHQHLVRSEVIVKEGKRILNRPDDKDKSDREKLSRTHLEQMQVNDAFRPIFQYFETFKYFHVIPQLIRNPQAFSGPGIPEDPYGQHFLEYLAKTNPKLRKNRLDKIQDALRIAVPRLQELSFVKDELGFPHLEAHYDHWRPKAGKQREDQFSDGTLRLIGLLWSILDTRDSLLLLEEPELSLNSGIIQNLVPIIYEIQKKKTKPSQVVVSSHSWELLSYSGIRGDEIIIFNPTHEGTDIKLASDIREIRKLLQSGMLPADAIFPVISPKNIGTQLTLLEF